ncbi:hypothetical protein RRG08_025006 [Elysia crispata]|uniref:Uncharacterized protein n=1 Tax=Elysia crispata TaxID=231223 RepID=A0AAE1ANJ3_9GAST|nr:hypothetical protein RRG08_025006 [Elysia crispata]
MGCLLQTSIAASRYLETATVLIIVRLEASAGRQTSRIYRNCSCLSPWDTRATRSRVSYSEILALGNDKSQLARSLGTNTNKHTALSLDWKKGRPRINSQCRPKRAQPAKQRQSFNEETSEQRLGSDDVPGLKLHWSHPPRTRTLACPRQIYQIASKSRA